MSTQPYDDWDPYWDHTPRRKRAAIGQGVVTEAERQRLIAEFVARGGEVKRVGPSDGRHMVHDWMRATKKERRETRLK